jgi:putative endonuclease
MGGGKGGDKKRVSLSPTPPIVMAGLVPAIHDLQTGPMRGGWVYIVTNRPNGILYTGVTRNIARRAWVHREGIVAGFTRRYGLKLPCCRC